MSITNDKDVTICPPANNGDSKPPAFLPPGCPLCSFFGPISFTSPPETHGKHPPWHRPSSSTSKSSDAANAGEHRGLVVNNSLTSTRIPFIPASSSSNRVLWYTCGPTVYDDCHMGHARAYLTLDILRRIMEEYFGYDVLYHVNVTDVDDKIILRARQNYLLDQFGKEKISGKNGKEDLDMVWVDVEEALQKKGDSLKKKRNKLEEALPKDAPSRDVTEREEALKEHALKETQYEELLPKVNTIKNDPNPSSDAASKLINLVKSELGELLDTRHGHTVSEHSIFNDHARKYELSFLEDMEALGVRPPDVLTRVTEYLPKIVDYVKVIVDKGLAYESNGSVYLSIEEFKARGHSYRKLKPFSGDTSEAEMAEGEGAIGSEASDKHHPNDFALWKKSRAGEPSWPSPWGPGRPGWHIECSVVASDILGPNIDIHAGGVDLKFPHHDNELAQSEAYYGHDQWVNYFFHAGHLSIKGLKMSKSLKNFITIRQALENHTARQIRVMFLLQNWDKPMNYSDQTVNDAKAKEALLRNFFGAVKHLLGRIEKTGSKSGGGKKSVPGWLDEEVGWRNADIDANLARTLSDTKKRIHDALCDNFDTPSAMKALCDLVRDTNGYLNGPPGEQPAIYLLRSIANYVTKILKMFGVVDGDDDIGFPLTSEGGDEMSGENKEDVLRPYLDALKDFRQEVRAVAVRKSPPDNSSVNAERELRDAILKSCDSIRDERLPPLGVRLEDLPTGECRWKLDDPTVLLRELQERKEAALAMAKQKRQKELDRATKKLADAEMAYIDPKEFVKKTRVGEYSEFDDEGMPTKDVDGEVVSKSARKKVQKLLSKHVKEHEKLLKEAKEAGLDVEEYLEKLRENVEKLQQI